MKIITIIEVGEDSHVQKKGKNVVRLLIEQKLCLPLVIMHKIHENNIRKVDFVRNGFDDRTKKVQELVAMGVEILLVY